MPNETTASLLVGPSDSVFGGDVFNPTAVALLREGARATWTLHATTIDEPRPTSIIRPQSPAHLLAVGLLGSVAWAAPQVISGDNRLTTLVHHEEEELLIDTLDRQDAHRVFTQLGEFISAVITVLPGCTTTEDELSMAKAAGFVVARAS